MLYCCANIFKVHVLDYKVIINKLKFLTCTLLRLIFLLTKLAQDHTMRMSTMGLYFCTDLAVLNPCCQDLGPIFSQYGLIYWKGSLMEYWRRLLQEHIQTGALIRDQALNGGGALNKIISAAFVSRKQINIIHCKWRESGSSSILS